MNIKRMLICTITSCFLFTSCSSVSREQDTESGTAKEIIESTATAVTEGVKKKSTGYTINVMTSYGGTAIDGRPLDNGSFSESFPIEKEMCFYEEQGCHWTTTETEGLKRYKSENLLLRIDNIKDDEISFSYHKGKNLVSKTIKTDEGFDIYSNYTVCDGIDYTYRITFTKKENE